MMKIRSNTCILLICLLFFSCNRYKKKYDGVWTTTEFIVNNEDFIDSLTTLNMLFDFSKDQAVCITKKGTGFRDVGHKRISMRRLEGKEYISVKNHSFLKGEFLLTCLTAECCALQMDNDSVVLRFNYEGDLRMESNRGCRNGKYVK